MRIPQEVRYIVEGAVIRTLVDRLEGAEENVGALLTVTTVHEDTFYTSSTANGSHDAWVFHKAPAVFGRGLGVGFEIASSPLWYSGQAEPPPAFVPEPPPAFVPEAWLNELMSSVGRRSVSDELRVEVAKCASKTEVNRIFFAWCEANPIDKQEVSRDAIALLNKVISPLTTPTYITAKRTADEYRERAVRYAREATSSLGVVAEQEAKMRELEGNSGVPLWDKIKPLVEAGWYQLDVGSLMVQTIGSRDFKVRFITPEIVMKHFNPKAGIESSVPMGQYAVTWLPLRNHIAVHTHANNILVDRYPHPHVSYDGDVCWGNAHAVMSEGMSNLDPVPGLEALQVILQNYNADSPFKALYRWEEQRKIEARKGMPTHMVETGSGWVREDDMPDNWASTYQIDFAQDRSFEDEDGEYETNAYHMRLFRKEYEDGTPAESNVYYIKYRNGTYCPVHVLEHE